MKILKIIIGTINSVIVTVITVILPKTIYNFKRENQIVKKKTKKGELIDLYGTFLMAPLLSLIIQLSARGVDVFFKPILAFLSFIFPAEVIVILGYRVWKFYKPDSSNNIKIKGLTRVKNIGIFLLNLIIWIFYSFIMIYIVFLSYDLAIKDSKYWSEHVSSYIFVYLFLLIMFILGKLIIGSYKEEYATKIKINYNYKGKDIEKEISFNCFEVKTEYVSFYIESDNKKYFIPWDKVNNISIYYK